MKRERIKTKKDRQREIGKQKYTDKRNEWKGKQKEIFKNRK